LLEAIEGVMLHRQSPLLDATDRSLLRWHSSTFDANEGVVLSLLSSFLDVTDGSLLHQGSSVFDANEGPLLVRRSRYACVYPRLMKLRGWCFVFCPLSLM
jgi:hypothetical protein